MSQSEALDKIFASFGTSTVTFFDDEDRPHANLARVKNILEEYAKEVRADELKKISVRVDRALNRTHTSSAYTGMFGQDQAIKSQKEAVEKALRSSY